MAATFAARLAAIAEVLAAFVLTHVAYRAIKQFTLIGQWDGAAQTNFTPGIVMVAVAVLAIAAGRRSFAGYGLGLEQWRYHLCLGLACSILMGVLEVFAWLMVRVQFDATRPPDPHAPINPLRLLGLATVVIPGYLAVLGLARKPRPWLNRVPAIVTLLGISALASLLPLTAMYCERRSMWLTALWIFFGAGFGEEIFFRGYIQSRVDEAFGRPWRVCGFEFGLGLLVSSLLFGLIHALNTVDYFHGRWDFGWSMGAQSVIVGLFYGLLRAKTQSVLPGAVIHGLSDIFAFAASLRPT
jgi:membrane protease YdiL (CAAX protease family)